MGITRILRASVATLTKSVYVDETLTDADAGLTVNVYRLDGTLVAGPTAASHPGVGLYSYNLPAQSQLDHLDVVWTGTISGSSLTLTDRVEVVGGFFFGLAEARASDSSLQNTQQYSSAMLAARRVEVEQECERITGWAFVPRFGRLTVAGDGSNVLTIPVQKLRSVRAITTHNWPDAAVIVSPLTNIVPDSGGQIVRYDGGIFPAGTNTVTVEFEHGWDYPPEEIRSKAMFRLRSLLNLTRTGIPDRVSSYSTPDGARYSVTLPHRGSTGLPEVDGVYCRYEAPPIGFA